MKTLLLKFAQMIVTAFVASLEPDDIKRLAGTGLDKFEEVVKDSSTAWDDAAVLPFIELARTTFDVPRAESA